MLVSRYLFSVSILRSPRLLAKLNRRFLPVCWGILFLILLQIGNGKACDVMPLSDLLKGKTVQVTGKIVRADKGVLYKVGLRDSQRWEDVSDDLGIQGDPTRPERVLAKWGMRFFGFEKNGDYRIVPGVKSRIDTLNSIKVFIQNDSIKERLRSKCQTSIEPIQIQLISTSGGISSQRLLRQFAENLAIPQAETG